MAESLMSCPFACGFETVSDYQITLHIETRHPEGNTISPFTVLGEVDDARLAVSDLPQHTPTPELDDGESYAFCPVEGCGEALLLTELESHVEMHAEERELSDDEEEVESNDGREKRVKLDSGANVEASFETKLSHALRNLNGDDDEQMRDQENARKVKQASAKAAWRELLKMPGTSSSKASVPSDTKKRRRLGKAELGPHANEKQMPTWLVKLLEQDGEVKIVNKIDIDGKMRTTKTCPNMATGVVPVLAQLLEQDSQCQYAFMCDPAVKHVSKLRREGGFCGYRNIQMLSSYIIGARSHGHDILEGRIPTIFQIQDYIEDAWDQGINAQGRIETGGIRGTRKYIGTPDAQAMLCNLGIGCSAQGLKARKDSPKPAYEMLFQAVEQYFEDGCTDYSPKIRCTRLPPIYFQHLGHSMTIVGIERSANGAINLIVFDPMFHDASNVLRLVGRTFTHSHPEDLLKAYRRGTKYLKKYNEFELLKLTPLRTQSTETAGFS